MDVFFSGGDCVSFSIISNSVNNSGRESRGRFDEQTQCTDCGHPY